MNKRRGVKELVVAAEIVDKEAENTEEKCHSAAKGLARSLVHWAGVQLHCYLYCSQEASSAQGPVRQAMNLRFLFFLSHTRHLLSLVVLEVA